MRTNQMIANTANCGTIQSGSVIATLSRQITHEIMPMQSKFVLIFTVFCQMLIGQELNFSVSSGFFEEEFEIMLSSTFFGDIRYTIDGSEPTSGSLMYINPILVKERNSEQNSISKIRTNPTATDLEYVWKVPVVTIPKARIVKAAVFNEDVLVSPIFYEEYFIGASLNEIQMPIFSIQTDSDDLFDNETGIYVAGKDYDDNPTEWQPGNYFKRGEEWKRVMSLTFYDDQQFIFRQNTELQIHGGGSRICLVKVCDYQLKAVWVWDFLNTLFLKIGLGQNTNDYYYVILDKIGITHFLRICCYKIC